MNPPIPTPVDPAIRRLILAVGRYIKAGGNFGKGELCVSYGVEIITSYNKCPEHLKPIFKKESYEK